MGMITSFINSKTFIKLHDYRCMIIELYNFSKKFLWLGIFKMKARTRLYTRSIKRITRQVIRFVMFFSNKGLIVTFSVKCSLFIHCLWMWYICDICTRKLCIFTITETIYHHRINKLFQIIYNWNNHWSEVFTSMYHTITPIHLIIEIIQI